MGADFNGTLCAKGLGEAVFKYTLSSTTMVLIMIGIYLAEDFIKSRL